MCNGSLAKRISVSLLAIMMYLASGNAICNPDQPVPESVSGMPFNRALKNGVLDLDRWNEQQTPLLSLSGQWRFFPNKLLTPRQLVQDFPGFSAMAQPIAVPASWNAKVGNDSWPSRGHGVGTYWLEISGHPGTPISLLVDRVCTSAQVYFFTESTPGSKPLAQLGRVGNTPQISAAYAGTSLVSLPFSANAGTHHLLIQVSNFDFFSGGLCGEIQLGNTAATRLHLDQTISNHSILIAMVGMAALYLVAIMTQRRNRNKRAIWLTLFCICCWLFFLSTSGLMEKLTLEHPQWLFAMRVKLAFVGLTWGSTALLMFYSHYFPLYKNRLMLKASLVLSSAFTAFALFSSSAAVTSLHTMWLLFWGSQILSSACILGRACLHRYRYSLHHLIAVAPLMLAIPYDAWTRVALNEMPIFSLYAVLFFIFAHSILMGRRISEAVGLAEKLSVYLKEQVNIRTAELNENNLRLQQTQRELEELNEALKKLSITDGLTGIYNRLFFEQEYRKEWRRSARLRKPISILMIDVDHFKRLNDSAGHMAGDVALRSIAATLNRHVKRAGDIVARYGGEEFVVMLPNTNQRTAVAVAEGIRSKIAQMDFSCDDRQYRITVSIGISTSTPSDKTSPDTLLATADSALYQAKNAGRNRVEAIPLLPSVTYGSNRRKRN